MSNAIRTICLTVFLGVFGCAHIDFGGDGMTYYDPMPYLFVSTTKECVTTATVITIPETKKVMKFVPGIGSSDLSATLSNGMIAAVGQKSDTKIPETISAVAGLATAGATLGKNVAESKAGCTPTATLYPVSSGVPDIEHPLSFPVTKEQSGWTYPNKF